MLKLVLLASLLIQGATLAIAKSSTTELVDDAVSKQALFDYFTQYSNNEERTLLKISSHRKPLEEIMNLDGVTIELNNKLDNDNIYCKVARNFSRLRGKKGIIFRSRTTAKTKKLAQEEIEKQCGNLEGLQKKINKDFLCATAAYKTAQCVDISDPSSISKKDVKKWLSIY